MREVTFTVEYLRGEEWHLFDGPYPTLRQARRAAELFKEIPGTKVRRVVEHRVRH